MQERQINDEQPRNDERPQYVELIQALDNIDALDRKPVELMISTINMPVDEAECRLAGEVLMELNESSFNKIPKKANELDKKWGAKHSTDS
jgi:hypothetical protein